MADPPPGKDAADEGESPEEKKKGESDPLFHPPGLKRRTTVMGLAPAPHLGGLSGTPGQIARAEAEARKQRIIGARNAAPAGSAAATKPTTVKPPAPSTPPLPSEELIEPLPAPYTGPPPPSVASGSQPPPAFMGLKSPIPPRPKSVHPEQPSITTSKPTNAKGKLSTQTLLMAPPHAGPKREPPPRQEVADAEVEPASSPGLNSEPTVLIEPPPQTQPTRPQGERPEHDRTRIMDPLPSRAPAMQQPPFTPSYGSPGYGAPPNAFGPPAQNQGPTATYGSPGMPYSASYAPNSQSHQGPATARMIAAAQPGGRSLTGPPPPPQQPSAALAIPQWIPPGASHALTGPLDERLILLNEPDSPRADGFRILRDSLIEKSLPRVVAVSSPAANDGKTTCAINLALALSEQRNTNVLLVDGNYFDPDIARIFTLDRLSPVVPPEDWLAPYKICAVTASLHVAGIIRGQGNPRFERHRFEALIDRLCRVNYDYLIIDCPALLKGAHTVSTMISYADGTILSVRAGGTTGRELKRAAEEIPAKKALGVALMDAT